MANCGYVYTKTSQEWLALINQLEAKIDDVILGDIDVKTAENDTDKIEYQSTDKTLQVLSSRLQYAKEQYNLALDYENNNQSCGVTFFKRECGY